jgi:hypothetical protein
MDTQCLFIKNLSFRHLGHHIERCIHIKSLQIILSFAMQSYKLHMSCNTVEFLDGIHWLCFCTMLGNVS